MFFQAGMIADIQSAIFGHHYTNTSLPGTDGRIFPSHSFSSLGYFALFGPLAASLDGVTVVWWWSCPKPDESAPLL